MLSEQYLEQYYCSYRLAENNDTHITISYSDADTAPVDFETVMICGYTVEIMHSDENSTKLFFEAGRGGYTIIVNGENHQNIAMQIAEDMLTEE